MVSLWIHCGFSDGEFVFPSIFLGPIFSSVVHGADVSPTIPAFLCWKMFVILC